LQEVNSTNSTPSSGETTTKTQARLQKHDLLTTAKDDHISRMNKPMADVVAATIKDLDYVQSKSRTASESAPIEEAR
jgi:hypothetical protein